MIINIYIYINIYTFFGGGGGFSVNLRNSIGKFLYCNLNVKYFFSVFQYIYQNSDVIYEL